MDGMSTAQLFQWEVNYATADDMQKLFAAAMNDLFCLAFLLTANVDSAEDCLVRSIRECLKNKYVLNERLPAWIRDTIVRNGINIVKDIEGLSFSDTPRDSIPLVPESSQGVIRATDYSAGILELNDLDRLVYVICILERYTSRQCALLLGRSREKVREARSRALAHIAEFESRWREIPVGSSPESKVLQCGCQTEVECSCGSLLD
jgi:DNA-directed RNA polymerase specialized sigma24 family protein